MKTILVASAIVYDGVLHAVGETITGPEAALQSFVDLSLATWVEGSRVETPAVGTAAAIPAETAPAPLPEPTSGL